MIFQAEMIRSMPIASIRSGARIGRVTGLVINPDSLHIDALHCQIIGSRGGLILLPIDIRSLSPHGIIIDDHEVLAEHNDLIRLQPLLKLNYQLDGKTAYVGKRRIGSVIGFGVDANSLYIQKIYVRPGILQRLGTDQLTFDRAQIKEVSRQAVYFIDSSTSPAKKIAERLGIVQSSPADFPVSSASTDLMSSNE